LKITNGSLPRSKKGGKFASVQDDRPARELSVKKKDESKLDRRSLAAPVKGRRKTLISSQRGAFALFKREGPAFRRTEKEKNEKKEKETEGTLAPAGRRRGGGILERPPRWERQCSQRGPQKKRQQHQKEGGEKKRYTRNLLFEHWEEKKKPRRSRVLGKGTSKKAFGGQEGGEKSPGKDVLPLCRKGMTANRKGKKENTCKVGVFGLLYERGEGEPAA